MRRGLGTKERIERAALLLFVEHGVAETSIREIAKSAGVSQGAMYNHYPSKEALTRALFSTGFSELGVELRRRAHEQPTVEGKLRSMIGHMLERFDQDWALMSFLCLVRHEQLRQVAHRMSNPYIVFRTVIADAIKNGELPRQDPELAASLVTGAVTQVIDVKILGRIKGDLASRSGEIAEACLRLVKG